MSTISKTILTDVQYKSMANAIRALTIDAVEKAKSGHPGMPLGMADFCTLLFSEFVKFNPQDPKWPDRDRVVLSAGHGSMLLYSLFYLLGYKDINIEDIKQFRQIHAKTAGHPEYGALSAIETTTGPLGQGIANAVGMAIAEKKLNAKFGDQYIDHHTYVICGDGCMMEGITQESVSLAGHLNLNKLILIFDDNKISIDGSTSLTISDDYQKKFEACNWNYIKVNGHDFNQIRAALFKAKRSDKPTIIAAETIIGFGSPGKAGTEKCHGSPLGSQEAELTKKKLGWSSKPFEIPEDILELWRSRYIASQNKYDKWQKEARQVVQGYLYQDNDFLVKESIIKLKNQLDIQRTESTRKTSGKVINEIERVLEQLIGGSADLSESNCTKANKMQYLMKDNFHGNYIYYGIREHAMLGIMNGISLHKGFIPYGGTFLVFSDYLRPSIRLACMMKQQVILLLTHDSIALGEDGPTHQPVEQLASLRAIPGLLVFRPADYNETIECWELALLNKDSPSVIILTRQNVPVVRKNIDAKNFTLYGAYIIKESVSAVPMVTIYSTGSEVALAIEVAQMLEDIKVSTRVVSMPCWEIFEKQSEDYKREILSNTGIKVAIEAGIKMGWERYVGEDGIFIGMNDYGISGPTSDLLQYFGFTKENIFKIINDRMIKGI